MNTSHDAHSQYACAGIDLGNGYCIEIRDGSLEVIGAKQSAPVNRIAALRTDEVCELALTLCQSRETSFEVARAAANLDPSGLNDETVETLVGRAAELIPQDPEHAYYVLNLTYRIARRFASLWKHALVSGIFGFLIVYYRDCPEEALPVFSDLQELSHMLGAYLGCSDNAQNLRQMAQQGLRAASPGHTDRSLRSESVPPEQIWSVVLEWSRAFDESEWFMQSEAAVRALYALPENVPGPTADALVDIGKKHLAGASLENHPIFSASLLNVITLADVLAARGATAHAHALLATIQAAHEHPSTLMYMILANRIATIQFTQGRPDLARQALNSVDYNDMVNLSSHSISAQGEFWLYCRNQEDQSCRRGDSKETRRWIKESLRSSRSIEQWGQIPSLTRRDDLRLLYGAILQNTIHARQPDLRRWS